MEERLSILDFMRKKSVKVMNLVQRFMGLAITKRGFTGLPDTDDPNCGERENYFVNYEISKFDTISLLKFELKNFEF